MTQKSFLEEAYFILTHAKPESSLCILKLTEGYSVLCIVENNETVYVKDSDPSADVRLSDLRKMVCGAEM